MYELTLSPFMYVVRDYDYSKWDEKNKEIMDRYIKEAANILKKKIAKLEDLDSDFSVVDEKGMKSLLESIIKTRQVWKEEFNK